MEIFVLQITQMYRIKLYQYCVRKQMCMEIEISIDT